MVDEAKVNEAFEKVKAVIDKVTAPSEMSREEYEEFVFMLKEDIDLRAEEFGDDDGDEDEEDDEEGDDDADE